MFRAIAFVSSLLACINLIAQVDATLLIKERGNGSPVGYVACALKKCDSPSIVHTALTDDDGLCEFADIEPGTYDLTVSSLSQTCIQNGIRILSSTKNPIVIEVLFSASELNEVVIIAKEGNGMTSASRIGQDAIKHIQPSSIADLLELLPGGSSKDPSFGSPQSIRLREADPVASYSTSSLGTQFMVDGVPINNDANLQSSPVSSNYGSSFTSEGVDMRSVTTDNIEYVEIIRGIPSVEYGDLTSGLVKIERKHGGNKSEARFKADMSSKLFSLGKAFEWSESDGGKLTLNADLSYLDARTDPRNVRQNYQRMTGSVRMRQQWNPLAHYSVSLGASLDYTGSFDDEKSDRDLNDGTNGPIEKYKSSYNRFAAAIDLKLRHNQPGFFRSFDLTMSMTSEQDKIDRWKVVELGMDTPVCTAQEPGEWDATIVPYTYESTVAVEGKPVYAYANAVANFLVKTPGLAYNGEPLAALGIKAGGTWNYSKNNGAGTIFDLERPFSTDMNVRPRVFKDIPALNQAHAFAEGNLTAYLDGFKLQWMLGVRAMTLVGIDKAYALKGQWKFDPRSNLRIDMPRFDLVGHPMRLALVGGMGWHTKFPTAEQLYPNPIYYDITQMNYWPSDPSLRRVNMAVFKTDVTNYSLNVARNLKWEATFEASWSDFSMAVTVFREDMKSGFRSSNTPMRYVYKDYDEQSIEASSLGGNPPSLATTPCVADTMLVTHSYTTNGSRTLKSGIEFTIVSPRIKPLHTRVSVSGAYFRTRYKNSQPEYYRPSVSINGKAFPYIGYYADTDNYLREKFNTNLNTDTQFPNIGLVFSTSFQCMWFSGSQTQYRDPVPLQYVDKELTYHDFTAESASNGVLSQLIRSYNTLAYVYTRVPFQMNINLKITKNLYHDQIAMALFANKLIDLSPSYVSPLGVTVRREVNPYFGMELNFKL